MKPDKCPFCGCTYPQVREEGAFDVYYYVQCPVCGARTTSRYTRENAIETWNKRA